VKQEVAAFFCLHIDVRTASADKMLVNVQHFFYNTLCSATQHGLYSGTGQRCTAAAGHFRDDTAADSLHSHRSSTVYADLHVKHAVFSPLAFASKWQCLRAIR
jgi:hypothetical protein